MPPTLPGPMSLAEGLAIFRRALDPHDYDALTSSPEGLAAVTGIVAVFADLSLRLDRTATARHLIPRASDVNLQASLAVAPTAQVVFARTRLGFEMTLPVGTVVATPDGHRYRTQAPASFAAGAAGPLPAVAAQAEVGAYVTATEAGTLTELVSTANGASGDLADVLYVGTVAVLDRVAGDRFYPQFAGLYVEFTAGMNAGRVVQVEAVLTEDRIRLGASDLYAESGTAEWVVRDWADLGVTATNPAASTEGRDADLETLAREVGLQPVTGQSEESLRASIWRMIDTVTPRAIVSIANRVLGDYGPVALLETGSAPIDVDASLGSVPWPGFVVGLTPAGLDEIAAMVVSADPPEAPIAGCSALGAVGNFFALRWDGAGLGDPGAYAERSVVVGADDAPLGVPMSMAAGESPAGGWAYDDDAIRAAIATAIDRARAGGVGWRFFPRYSPIDS